MNDDNFPGISQELVNYLDELYPNKTPGRFESLEDIRFKTGQRSVVEYLIDKLNEFSDNIFTKN